MSKMIAAGLRGRGYDCRRCAGVGVEREEGPQASMLDRGMEQAENEAEGTGGILLSG